MTSENVAVAAAKEHPERLIEVTIGLWPDDDPPGTRPPRLAAGIVKTLRDEGYMITHESATRRATPFKYVQRRTFCWRHLTWLCDRHG